MNGNSETFLENSNALRVLQLVEVLIYGDMLPIEVAA
jgi:hypothetical protein